MRRGAAPADSRLLSLRTDHGRMMTCVAQARRRALTHAYLLSYDRFERVASPMTPFAAGGSALLAPRAPLVAGVPAAKASAAHRRSAQRPCRPSLAPRAAPDSASDVTSAFSTEPGGWSSSFEKRDEKKPGSSGAPGSDAVCLPVAPEEVADLPLTSEVRAPSGRAAIRPAIRPPYRSLALPTRRAAAPCRSAAPCTAHAARLR